MQNWHSQVLQVTPQGIFPSCPQNYKFEGHERDAESGLDDFGARFYNSDSPIAATPFGRFLSADWSTVPAPVPYANLANPQTLDLYAIVSDNVETFADLDGHGECPFARTITWLAAFCHQNAPDSVSGRDAPISSSIKAAAAAAQAAPAQQQGGGQSSGSATFNLGGVKVTFKGETDDSVGGVWITATPKGCDNCNWAQTVSGTGVPGGTKADTQPGADAKKYPFAAGTEVGGQLWDRPSTSHLINSSGG